jgi:hypothetical protein
LSYDIAAVQLFSSEEGERMLGPVVTLPRDARVTVCGEGFDSRTLKVCCGGVYYFVFTRDLIGSDNT